MDALKCQVRDAGMWENGWWEEFELEKEANLIYMEGKGLWGIRWFLRAYLPGQEENGRPFEDEEMRMGFDAYMRNALATKKLFDTGEFVRVWEAKLAEFPMVRGFKIASWNFAKLNGDPGWEGLKLDRIRALCREAQGVVGDRLFEDAIRVMQGVRVEALDLAGCVSGNQTWIENLLTWDL